MRTAPLARGDATTFTLPSGIADPLWRVTAGQLGMVDPVSPGVR
jgi:hypothetical protein